MNGQYYSAVSNRKISLILQNIKSTYSNGQLFIPSTETEQEIAGLPDIDAVPNLIEQEGEAFPPNDGRVVLVRDVQLIVLSARFLHQDGDQCHHLLQRHGLVGFLCYGDHFFLFIIRRNLNLAKVVQIVSLEKGKKHNSHLQYLSLLPEGSYSY